MKHPKYRCSDILFMDPQARDTVYNFIRSTRDLLHPFIRDNMVRFENVGSITFGNNKLHSDWDFNIAMKDWNDQFTARRIFYGNIGGWRRDLTDATNAFEKETGLKLDIGAVDCDTLKYNIGVDLSTMLLYGRNSPRQEVLLADPAGIVWEQEQDTIDLATFDPFKDSAPPVAHIHLKWNFMLHRWQTMPLSTDKFVTFSSAPRGVASWAEDPWADLVPEWQQRYTDRFQTYHQDGTQLIED